MVCTVQTLVMRDVTMWGEWTNEWTNRPMNGPMNGPMDQMGWVEYGILSPGISLARITSITSAPAPPAARLFRRGRAGWVSTPRRGLKAQIIHYDTIHIRARSHVYIFLSRLNPSVFFCFLVFNSSVFNSLSHHPSPPVTTRKKPRFSFLLVGWPRLKPSSPEFGRKEQ